MKDQHWHIWRGNHSAIMVRDALGFVVADVPHINNSRAQHLNESREERAALIAALPDLLHALHIVHANAADHPDVIRSIIEAAWNKARAHKAAA